VSQHDQHFVLVPAGARGGSNLLGTAIKLTLFLGLLFILGLSAYLTWQWFDRNFLHWGIEDSKVTRIEKTELVEKLRAFELVTVKYRYEATAGTDVDKSLRAGPASVGLPGWIAGQTMEVQGEVLVSAGVDLSTLMPEDIEVVQSGAETLVIIHLPEPRVTSTEILRGTFDVDTSQGLLTRAKSRIGLGEKDLRDEAPDRLVEAAQASAMQSGILVEAGQETRVRLGQFLQDVQQARGGSVVYEVRISGVSVH
jgi:hypothetical protein